MNNHPHIATPYEIRALAQRRLKAIVLPLLPEPTKHSATWSWSGSPRSHIDWLHDSSCDDIRLFMALKYQVSDRIYLQEEWVSLSAEEWNELYPKGKNEHTSDKYYYLKSSFSGLNLKWQPASTMPMEAAQHWFAIVGVRVVQMGKLTFQDAVDAGCKCFPVAGSKGYKSELVGLAELQSFWNAAYPEQPWQGDRWVIVLDINPNPEPQFLQP